MTRSGFFSVDSLRGVWVLVVDPDPHGRQTLVEILSYCGALVTPLASPAEALNMMRQVKPDVLVVTLAPSGDLAFIRLVRALKPEEGGVVPAIAVGSADSPSDDTVRSRGFQASLRKPLDPWALCRVVSELVTMP
jgi:CheY-like chemotaxis protein